MAKYLGTGLQVMHTKQKCNQEIHTKLLKIKKSNWSVTSIERCFRADRHLVQEEYLNQFFESNDDAKNWTFNRKNRNKISQSFHKPRNTVSR